MSYGRGLTKFFRAEFGQNSLTAERRRNLLISCNISKSLEISVDNIIVWRTMAAIFIRVNAHE